MKTTITLEIEHSKPIDNLAKLVEQRAYTIDGVSEANWYSFYVKPDPTPTPGVVSSDVAEALKARATLKGQP